MSQSMKYVLVTGTNGGLGLGICTRLIDDFLRTQPQTSSLTLIFTTRSTRKGQETLSSLNTHISKNHTAKSQSRVHLQPENVELTSLLNVRALADKLLRSSIPHINAVILNAGIGGWSGLNWPRAVQDVTLHMINNTTWPQFKLGIAGLITDKQIPAREGTSATDKQEPIVGQIFCANVFGHYLLTHWLMPLLRACEPTDPARIIWVSSIEPMEKHFKEEDLQGLSTTVSYESSKRLTDLLVLTSNTKAVKRSYQEYTSTGDDGNAAAKRKTLSTPTMHVAQPGICTTAIVALYWIVHQFYVLSIYMARWLGSPWATVSTYLAAMSFTWLAFAPADEIRSREARGGGKVKWGTATDRLGTASVRVTEVQGWGLDGSGEPFAASWWGGGYGRAPGSRDATREDVDGFVECGARVWREMERMRTEWEALLREV